ncbi:Geranylgeranyl transferase type-2 subunit alpha 1 [Linum perenne]
MNKKAQGFTNREEVLTREYELVREALFTDEDDQSGWFYHLWLLGQTVRSEYPILVSSWPIHGSDITLPAADCLSGCASPVNLFSFSSKKFPLILYFNESVEGVNSSTVSVSDGLSSTTGLIWKPLSVSDSSQSAKVWATHFDLPDRDTDSSKAYQVEVKVGHSPGIVSSICVQYHCPCQVSFQLHVQNSKLESGEGSSSGRMQWEDDCFSLYEPGSAAHDLIDLLDNLRIKNGPELTTSPWQERILDEETSIFRPVYCSKIGKLTLARLLTAYDLWRPFDKPVHSKEILELYSELMKLDPPHRQYYKDNHSLVLLQQLGSFEKLLWVQVLDLSNNELQSIKGMEAMQLLSCLCLSNNKLRSFSALEPLRHLTSLRVLDVSDNEIGAHSIDTTRYQFCSPLSHSVGSDWHSNDMSCSEYWEAYFTLKDTRLTQIDVVGNAIASESFSLFLEKVLPTLKWLDGVQVK